MGNRITKESMEFIAGEMAVGYRIFHRQQDVYHKALVYCLGISGDTRRNIGRIFDFKKGSVKPECLEEYTEG